MQRVEVWPEAARDKQAKFFSPKVKHCFAFHSTITLNALRKAGKAVLSRPRRGLRGGKQTYYEHYDTPLWQWEDISICFIAPRYLRQALKQGTMKEETENRIAEPTAGSNGAYSALQGDWFAWILDENLLRDEGVMFGISEGEAEPKTQTIRLYFQEMIALRQKESELLQAEIAKAAAELEEQEAASARLAAAIRELAGGMPPAPHSFYRVLAGLLAYAVMTAFTFFAIYQWLRPHWDYPLLTALGVYCFGALSLYAKRSFLYQAGPSPADGQAPAGRDAWKIYLEELGIPLVATLFILFWGAQEVPWHQMLSFGLLLYFLFLFSGKGLLSSIQRVPREFAILRANWAQRRRAKAESAAKKQELAELGQASETRSAQMSELARQRKTLEIEISGLEEKSAVAVAYFLSEYHLARAASSTLTSEQLTKLSLHP